VLERMLEKAVKDYITQHNITQIKFAELIGISDRALRYFISGLKCPSIKIMNRISVLTGVSMDELSKDFFKK